MNAAEHYAAAEAILTQLESEDLAASPQSGLAWATVALTHANLAIAAEAGVPQNGPHPAAQAGGPG